MSGMPFPSGMGTPHLSTGHRLPPPGSALAKFTEDVASKASPLSAASNDNLSSTGGLKINEPIAGVSKPQSFAPSQSQNGDGSSINTYLSAHSRISFDSFYSFLTRFSNSSIFVDSGRPSMEGATWKQALHITSNSGFGPAGAPRGLGNNGVRQGRERGGFLPRVLGVGRTGKAPYPVPQEMVRALEDARAASSTPQQTVLPHDADPDQGKAVVDFRKRVRKLRTEEEKLVAEFARFQKEHAHDGRVPVYSMDGRNEAERLGDGWVDFGKLMAPLVMIDTELLLGRKTTVGDVDLKALNKLEWTIEILESDFYDLVKQVEQPPEWWQAERGG